MRPSPAQRWRAKDRMPRAPPKTAHEGRGVTHNTTDPPDLIDLCTYEYDPLETAHNEVAEVTLINDSAIYAYPPGPSQCPLCSWASQAKDTAAVTSVEKHLTRIHLVEKPKRRWRCRICNTIADGIKMRSHVCETQGETPHTSPTPTPTPTPPHTQTPPLSHPSRAEPTGLFFRTCSGSSARHGIVFTFTVRGSGLSTHPRQCRAVHSCKYIYAELAP